MPLFPVYLVWPYVALNATDRIWSRLIPMSSSSLRVSDSSPETVARYWLRRLQALVALVAVLRTRSAIRLRCEFFVEFAMVPVP